MMGTIFELQQGLYSGSIEALKTLHTAGIAGLPSLIGAAFGFGMLHALLPGHGKSVLTSYYAGDGHLLGALGSSTLLILTHVGSAIALVLSGFVILQRTIAGAGRSPALEHASQILILLVGLWMLWRAFRPHSHKHARSASALAIATGLVPCPLTTFIMTYAAANGIIASGLILSGAFSAGMVVTVVACPLLAVLLRTKLLPVMARTEAWCGRVGHGLEIAAAFAVILLGIWPLLSR
ncbi:putative nickel ABC transporter, permease protein [Beijerinckia indica subsp. indica ATCC 9039]|uniref:Putative nickel ABC transporter, permease protein n=2 Tax=Beijerinckia TaxID=532 RepID=B2IIS2_BEII9|nr:putative nickel ABC transporter, permease protein [Beijerinckia indica subsp. indica ATCC 9039]